MEQTRQSRAENRRFEQKNEIMKNSDMEKLMEIKVKLSSMDEKINGMCSKFEQFLSDYNVNRNCYYKTKDELLANMGEVNVLCENLKITLKDHIKNHDNISLGWWVRNWPSLGLMMAGSALGGSVILKFTGI